MFSKQNCSHAKGGDDVSTSSFKAFNILLRETQRRKTGKCVTKFSFEKPLIQKYASEKLLKLLKKGKGMFACDGKCECCQLFDLSGTFFLRKQIEKFPFLSTKLKFSSYLLSNDHDVTSFRSPFDSRMRKAFEKS